MSDSVFDRKSFSELQAPRQRYTKKVEIIHVDKDGSAKEISTRPINKSFATLATQEEFTSVFGNIKNLPGSEWVPFFNSDKNICRHSLTTCREKDAEYILDTEVRLASILKETATIYPFGFTTWRILGEKPFVEKDVILVIIDDTRRVITGEGTFNLKGNTYQITIRNMFISETQIFPQDIVLPAVFRTSVPLEYM